MPKVERGSKVIPIEVILGLSDEGLKSLVEWALEVKALTVTLPSIVYVEAGGGVPLALGVGSLISGEEPPFGVKYFVISRVSWVDGCFVGIKSPSFKVPKGSSMKFYGTLRALDFKDPVALLINGISGEHEIVLAEFRDRRGAIASLDNTFVLYKLDKGYVSLLMSGEGARRISYMAPLASSCSKMGGDFFED